MRSQPQLTTEEKKAVQPTIEEKKAVWPTIEVTLDVDRSDEEEDGHIAWILNFKIVFALGVTTEYSVHHPEETSLQTWRELARGVPDTIVCDLNSDNGTIEVVGETCVFSTGTNCRDTTNTSATTRVPLVWIAAPLSRALDEVEREGLPFAA
jgi:hypothetical protein